VATKLSKFLNSKTITIYNKMLIDGETDSEKFMILELELGKFTLR